MGAAGWSPALAAASRLEGADAAQGASLSTFVSDLPEARVSTVTPVANVSFSPPGCKEVTFWLQTACGHLYEVGKIPKNDRIVGLQGLRALNFLKALLLIAHVTSSWKGVFHCVLNPCVKLTLDEPFIKSQFCASSCVLSVPFSAQKQIVTIANYIQIKYGF